MPSEKTLELARDCADEMQRARYGECDRCDSALDDAGVCSGCGEYPRQGYESHCRGVALLERGETPVNRSDLAHALYALHAFRGDAIGAGANTWRAASLRYESARLRFAELSANRRSL